MQQFTVPQFIEVEDKIIGPVTVRQFLIMIAGFSVLVIAYNLLVLSAFIVVLVFVFFVFGAFAFLKVNGMPMHFFVLNFIQTIKRPSVRVWNKTYRENMKIEEKIDKNDLIVDYSFRVEKRKYSSSRLNELSLIVDTSGVYKGEK